MISNIYIGPSYLIKGFTFLDLLSMKFTKFKVVFIRKVRFEDNVFLNFQTPGYLTWYLNSHITTFVF